MAPPVASVESSTFMSRPKAFIVSASSGLTMRGCNGEVLASLLAPVCGLANGRRDRCVMIAPPLAIQRLVMATIVPDRICFDGAL